MAAIRTAFRQKSTATAVLMALGIAMVSSAAPRDKTPPPELVQYIRETKRRGTTDAKIKSQAVEVGWSAAVVDEALAYVRNEKAPPKTVPDATLIAPSAALPTRTQSEGATTELASPKQPQALPESSLSR